MPRLVVKAAARVIEGLELDPAQVKDLIQKVLDEAPEGERVELRMNPQDLQLLKGSMRLLSTKLNQTLLNPMKTFLKHCLGYLVAEVLTVSAKFYPDVEFIEDETLGRGDCMMESRYGLVDGRIMLQNLLPLRRAWEEDS